MLFEKTPSLECDLTSNIEKKDSILNQSDRKSISQAPIEVNISQIQ